MTGWLLDTNVISELRRPKPAAKVIAFIASQPLDQMFISTISFAEIRFGIEMVAYAARRAAFRDCFKSRSGGRLSAIFCAPVLTYLRTLRSGAQKSHPADSPDRLLKQSLSDWLTHKVRPMFEARVLPVSEDVMLKWRLLVEQGRKAGHTYSQPDLIIAATAFNHGLTLVTRDTADFTKTRVPVLNPWHDTSGFAQLRP